tara:strand:- start:25511 stop:26167 length:657 start_codon:yes stop_codon:yes gene_type:complete
MKRLTLSFALLALTACGASQASETPTAPVAQAEMAPETTPADTATANAVADANWTLTDLNGQEVSLASYQGKTVVLEWFSPTCPFIVHAHGEGPLKDMASKVTASGDVVWLAINSNSKGSAAELDTNKQAAADWNISHPVLMDSDGAVGRMYGAKTTPHMFVIDPAGEVVYKGALDNAPRGEAEGEYVNYVEAALGNIAAGTPVALAETKSYGCGVKY